MKLKLLIPIFFSFLIMITFFSFIYEDTVKYKETISKVQCKKKSFNRGPWIVMCDITTVNGKSFHTNKISGADKIGDKIIVKEYRNIITGKIRHKLEPNKNN